MSVIVFQCLSLFLMRRGCMPYTLPDSMHCKLVVSCVFNPLLMEKTKSHAMFFFSSYTISSSKLSPAFKLLQQTVDTLTWELPAVLFLSHIYSLFGQQKHVSVQENTYVVATCSTGCKISVLLYLWPAHQHGSRWLNGHLKCMKNLYYRQCSGYPHQGHKT